MTKRFLALGLVLAAAGTASSATYYVDCNANGDAGAASVIYVRVFWEGETVAAATTASTEIKSGEGMQFSRAFNISAISILSASASTVRLIYW